MLESSVLILNFGFMVCHMTAVKCFPNPFWSKIPVTVTFCSCQLPNAWKDKDSCFKAKEERNQILWAYLVFSSTSVSINACF